MSCKVTGSALLSDAWENIADTIEAVPDAVYICQSKMIVEGEISIYDGNAFGDDEEDQSDVVKVNDIVSKFCLQQCEGLTKKDFKAMFMGHVKRCMKDGKMKKLAKESEEGKAAFTAFQASAKAALTFFLKVYKDCDIYMNEDQDAEGAYVVGWWNPESAVQDAPQMCCWLSGCDFRKM